MTLATLLPYLIFAAGWLARHWDVLGKLLGVLGGGNPFAAPSAPLPVVKIPLPTVLGSHPVLSDAVNAAIKQAVQDEISGHITSLKSEILLAAKAAAAAAAADLKAKV